MIRLLAESQDYERGGTQKAQYSADEVAQVPCPLCGSEEREEIYQEHGAIGIVQCRQCALVYTSPRILEPEKIYWGEEAQYLQEARLIFEGKLPHHRDPNYLGEIRAVERFKSRGRFLDVGCNMGMLIRIAHQRGWDVVGLEPSPTLAALARRHGLPIYNCFLHDMPAREEESFDVVAFSDVFEHITNPLGFLQQAARYLRKDGVLYVKVPNVKWSLFKQSVLGLLGKRPTQGLWDAYEHVVHYSDQTLRQMLKKGGFEVLKLSLERPVQTPNWHEHVGHYYQYPTPFLLDWKRQSARAMCYHLSKLERAIRLGSIGSLAPNLVAVARRV